MGIQWIVNTFNCLYYNGMRQNARTLGHGVSRVMHNGPTDPWRSGGRNYRMRRK